MRFKNRRALAAVAVIGAIAAGGAADTAGSGFATVPAASYSGTTIQGATASALSFEYSNDGTLITKADVVLNGDYTIAGLGVGSPYTIKAGFGIDTGTGATVLTAPCVANLATGGTVGSMLTVVGAGDTGVVCTFPGVRRNHNCRPSVQPVGSKHESDWLTIVRPAGGRPWASPGPAPAGGPTAD